MLYIYPQSLDFRNSKGRNIGIKVQFMAGEDPGNDALQVSVSMGHLDSFSDALFVF